MGRKRKRRVGIRKKRVGTRKRRVGSKGGRVSTTGGKERGSESVVVICLFVIPQRPSSD